MSGALPVIHMDSLFMIAVFLQPRFVCIRICGISQGNKRKRYDAIGYFEKCAYGFHAFLSGANAGPYRAQSQLMRSKEDGVRGQAAVLDEIAGRGSELGVAAHENRRGGMRRHRGMGVDVRDFCEERFVRDDDEMPRLLVAR